MKIIDILISFEAKEENKKIFVGLKELFCDNSYYK